MGEGGHQSDPGHPPPGGDAQPESLRIVQGQDHLESPHQGRRGVRQGRLHVPGQHRSYDSRGESGSRLFILLGKATVILFGGPFILSLHLFATALLFGGSFILFLYFFVY